MEEQIGNPAPKKIRKGKSKPALFISVGILVAAICMIVASVICLPRDKIIKTKGGNVVEVIAFENGGLLYAASDGTVFSSGEDFSQWLIKNKLISAVPWDDVGPYIRFGATFVARGGQKEEEEVLAEFARRLSDAKFTF